MVLMLETGEMREEDQSSREQMGPLVCMSLEEMEWSVSTAREVVHHTHQDCGDVIFLTPMERCRVSSSTLLIMNHMVN